MDVTALSTRLGVAPVILEPGAPLEAILADRRLVERMQSLPPTESLEAAYGDAERRLAEIADEASESYRRALDRQRLELRRAMMWGRRRDAIAADRPAGCWCLGSGGSGEVAMQPLASDPTDPTDRGTVYHVPPVVKQRYCSCPEGVRQLQRRNDLVALRQTARDQARLDTLWNRASVPEKYREAELRNCIVLPETAPSHDLAARWLDTRQPWLLLTGPTGAGKTWLAAALMRKLVERSYEAPAPEPIALYSPNRGPDATGATSIMVLVPRLMASIRSTFNPGATTSEDALLASIVHAGVLVLDDLGSERIVKRPGEDVSWVEETLFRLIDERAELRGRRTIITSNLTLAQLRARLGERSYWRILEQCEPDGIVPFPDDSPNLREWSVRNSLP